MRIVVRVTTAKRKLPKDFPRTAFLRLKLDRTIDNQDGYLQFCGYTEEKFDFLKVPSKDELPQAQTNTVVIGFTKDEAAAIRAILKINPNVRIWVQRMVELI